MWSERLSRERERERERERGGGGACDERRFSIAKKGQ